MLAFYDFPAEHWTSIRTTNPIESAFATVRLRTAKMRNCGSRNTTLAMVFKLLETAQKRWNRLHGFALLTRSEEHTSELQSRGHLVCRLLLEKKNKEKD